MSTPIKKPAGLGRRAVVHFKIRSEGRRSPDPMMVVMGGEHETVV
jgi:hypothetical protein